MTIKPTRFELTPELITLLRNSYVDTELSSGEYGAAEIDCKRPYGFSDVEGSLCALFGHDDNDVNRAYVAHLHLQTPTALQIVLHTGTFEPGIYEASAYTTKWRLVADLEGEN